MTGYRRFVSYVYEYRNGKKESSCGFVKAEVKADICHLEIKLQCPGLAPGGKCNIYGFVRKDGLMNGILLGSCMTECDRIRCTVEEKEGDLGGFGIGLEKLGGLLLIGKEGGFWGTQWDDEIIRPENFREWKFPVKKEQPDISEEQKTENTDMKKEVEAEEYVREEEKQEEVMSLPEESEPISDYPVKSEPEEPQSMLKDLTSSLEAEPSDLKSPICSQSRLPQGDFERPIPPPKPPHSGPGRPLPPPEPPHLGPGRPLPPPPPGPLHPGSDRPLSGGPSGCTPFDDCEFQNCKKIRPSDCRSFCRRERGLCNNRFLLYGYESFGHILLCRTRKGKYILGVPGVYNQQERFMAGMFGFPYFKESRQINVPGGKGGYWYCFIHGPEKC